jgi:serine/threonine-protein kinase
VDGSPPDGGDQDRRRRRWPWLLLLLIALAGGAVTAYLITRPAKDTVPPVVGQTLSIAQAEVQNAGLMPNIQYRTDDTHPSGVVINQNPLGGQKVDSGSTVTLTVSSGPGNGSVPSLEGLPLRQAKDLLRSSKLKPGRVVYQPSSQWSAGLVFGSEPPAGQTVPIGTSVSLFVSSGQPKQAVTTVTTTTPSSTVTTPTTTTTPPVQVPVVKGNTAAAATAALQQAGFQVTQTTKDVILKGNDGKVLTQTPGGGQKAAKGSTVTIVVGHFPTTTTTTTNTTTTSSTSTTKTK